MANVKDELSGDDPTAQATALLQVSPKQSPCNETYHEAPQIVLQYCTQGQPLAALNVYSSNHLGGLIVVVSTTCFFSAMLLLLFCKLT